VFIVNSENTRYYVTQFTYRRVKPAFKRTVGTTFFCVTGRLCIIQVIEVNLKISTKDWLFNNTSKVIFTTNLVTETI